MLNQLKNWTNGDRYDVSELVAMIALGTSMKDTYEALGLDVPDWLERNLKAVRREVVARNADKIEQTIKETKNKLAALETPTQKKARLEKELKDLTQKAKAAGVEV